MLCACAAAVAGRVAGNTAGDQRHLFGNLRFVLQPQRHFHRWSRQERIFGRCEFGLTSLLFSSILTQVTKESKYLKSQGDIVRGQS